MVLRFWKKMGTIPLLTPYIPKVEHECSEDKLFRNSSVHKQSVLTGKDQQEINPSVVSSKWC